MVLRESVQIALTIAVLNDLDILACDVHDSYLTTECRERMWIVASIEFDSEEGLCMIFKKSLYELKISGAAFMEKLEETLDAMCYKSSYVDPYVWIRPSVNSNEF